MKILVVDDSATMRRIIIKNLNDAGYAEIVEAENGLEAIGKMGGVNLVLTDWNMPVMDGLSFVKEIRQNEAFAQVPIVMITSIGGSGDTISRVEEYLTERRDKAAGKARVAASTIDISQVELKDAEQAALADQALSEFAAAYGLEMPATEAAKPVADVAPPVKDMGPGTPQAEG